MNHYGRGFNDRPNYSGLWVGLVVMFIIFGLITAILK